MNKRTTLGERDDFLKDIRCKVRHKDIRYKNVRYKVRYKSYKVGGRDDFLACVHNCKA